MEDPHGGDHRRQCERGERPVGARPGLCRRGPTGPGRFVYRHDIDVRQLEHELLRRDGERALGRARVLPDDRNG